jgi:hypothetical protein
MGLVLSQGYSLDFLVSHLPTSRVFTTVKAAGYLETFGGRLIIAKRMSVAWDRAQQGSFDQPPTGNPNRQLSIPASSLGKHWIAKLPSPTYPNPPENEFSMMEFAREIGIQVPEVGLIPLAQIAEVSEPVTAVEGKRLLHPAM